MWLLVQKFLNKLLADDANKGTLSFAKATSLPFLITAWAVGTIYGGLVLWDARGDAARNDPSELIWTMAGVAMVLYASYKTGHVMLKRGEGGKVEIVSEETSTKTVKTTGAAAPDSQTNYDADAA